MTTDIQAGDYVEITDTSYFNGARWVQNRLVMLFNPQLLRPGDIVRISQVSHPNPDETYAWYIDGQGDTACLPIHSLRKVAAPPVSDWPFFLTDLMVLMIGLISLIRWEKLVQVTLDPVAQQAIVYLTAGTCYLALATLGWMLLKSIGRSIATRKEQQRRIRHEEDEKYAQRRKTEREEIARETKQREEAQLKHDTAVAIAQMKEAISQVKPIIAETVKVTIASLSLDNAQSNLIRFGRVITNNDHPMHPNGKRKLEEGDIIEITKAISHPEDPKYYNYRCLQGTARIAKSDVVPIF